MPDERRFDGRVAIVTGAGGGLGRAYARLLAARGAQVLVNDLGGSMRGEGAGTAAADRVVAEIEAAGGTAVANYDSVEAGEQIVAAALDHFGRVDIVINNAGILRDVSFHKMSDDDWAALYRVHLLGAYRVTHAAWPHLRQQRYGRVIMTSSAAGLYGNFGQANYSAVKLGLLGLANSLAIEGERRGIHVNTIAPVAGSRLTATILPEELVDALKPEYVAPLVAYLCHESCPVTGGLFEVGAGWVARLRWERSQGLFLPLREPVTIEKLAANWATVDDFQAADHPAGAQASFAPLLANLKTAVPRRGNEYIDLDKLLGHQLAPRDYTYAERDVSLYALSVGAAANPLDDAELKFVYELHPDFQPLPTFAVTFPFVVMDQLLDLPGLTFNPMLLLHGEQYLEVKRPLPTAATITNQATIAQVYDKGSGALLLVDIDSRDAAGEVVATNQTAVFIRGIGGFGGERGPSTADLNRPPARPPDAVYRDVTGDNQALLYRLSSGDRNPLHVDPAFAAVGGFDRPILHGLCTFGFAGRAVLRQFGGHDPARFQSIRARFSRHVFPGETLLTEMWVESPARILFQTRVVERDELVLTNGAVELRPAGEPAPEAAAAPVAAPAADGSALLFAAIGRRLAADPALAARVQGTFQFHLTGDGGGDYVVDLQQPPGQVYAGRAETADCTVTAAYADFQAMVDGRLPAQSAFLEGKLKLAGDLMLATRLEQLLRP